MAGPRAEDGRAAPRGDRVLPRGGGRSARFRRCLLEPWRTSRTYRFSEAEMTRMRHGEASPATSPVDRLHLSFALGKALEDRGEIAESWRYYERGNGLQRAQSRYRPEILETNTAKQIQVCTPAFFEQRTGWGDPRPDPIFILGLPRSGSTLLEQILASHSLVEGTQELSDIPRIVLELQGSRPGPGQSALPGGAGRADPRRLSPAGRALPGRHPGLSHRAAVLHRQDAKQLPPHRPYPPDAAERPDHRRSPRADGLLLQQPQAAVRAGPGVYLQRRGHRPLLPHLPRPDAALGRRVAWPGAAGSITRTS